MTTWVSAGAGLYIGGSFQGVAGPGGDVIDEAGAVKNDIFEAGEAISYNGTAVGETFLGTAVVDGVTVVVIQSFSITRYEVPDGVNPNTISWPSSQSSISLNTSAHPLCFLAGTMIAAEGRPVAVEALEIGDRIWTRDGSLAAVKWVGVQTVHKMFHGSHLQPVRIQAGALGEGLPREDLCVTADHGMVIDDVVINASALVNGTTIDFVPLDELGDSFAVYHIETEHHDVVLANGAATETFIDAAGRAAFDNYQEYLERYGVERLIPEMPYPRVATQRMIPDAIKERLGLVAARAEAPGLVKDSA